MPNLVGIGLSQVPTNSMLGGMAYQDPEHASIKDLDLKNLSQINSEIADTAVDVFIYDTSKDSDGGAWRKRTQHTSWYNETLGTATRGTRREFPAVAVIVAQETSNQQVVIYDGDDPDLPMWMVFERGGNNDPFLDGSTPGASFLGNYPPTSVSAFNGIICAGCWRSAGALSNLNAGLRRFSFIEDNCIAFNNSNSYKIGDVIANRNVITMSQYALGNPIVNVNVRDVAMTVLPNAPIDDATGLPVPTIAVATDGGVSVIKDDGTVVDITSANGGNYHQSKEITITEENYLWLLADYNAGSAYLRDSYAVSLVSFPSSDFTWNNSSDNLSAGTFYALTTNGEAGEIKIGPGNTWAWNHQERNALGGPAGLAIHKPNIGNESNSLIVAITSDYNTGWMHGDIKGAFLSDTVTEKDGVNYALTADKGSTNRLSSETYANGATSWQMVDNAGTANGYVVVEFKGLTVGQTYKISMTWDNNAALDSGYQHRVAHKNSTADENDTNFTHWNKTNGSSETLTGVFTAQSANNDDLVIYANAITLNISNFSVVETDDADGTSLIPNGNFSANTTGAFTTVGGGTAAVTGGLLRLTDTSGSFCYASAPFTTVIGDQYFVTVDIVNNSNTANANYIRCGNSHNGTELHNTNYGTSYGTKTFYFTATATTTYLTLISGNGVGETGHWDNVFVYKLDNDRSVNTKGLQPYGSITKSAVATGAELVSYSEFNNNNYLRQPYNSDLRFEQNDFSIMFWIYDTGVNEHTTIISKDEREFDISRLGAAYGNKLRIYTRNSSEDLRHSDSSSALPFNKWVCVCVVYTGGNTKKVYLDGVLDTTITGTNGEYDIDSTSYGLNIGVRNTGGTNAYSATGIKLALVRMGASAPSDEQIKKIYEDEKVLFQENAKATLYGSSDAVTALAYDETTDQLHVGTSSGRSDFQGLRRINNTTTAVTTAISAHDEFIIEQ